MSADMLLWPWRQMVPTIADMIRSKLDAGTLPRENHIKLWTGYGSGRPCVACEQIILRAQVEHELELADGRMIQMHVGCASLYKAERSRTRLVSTAHTVDRAMKKPPALAVIIREKMAVGHLPPDDYLSLRAVYGQGGLCAACDHPILHSQVEQEMRFADGRVISMHFGCVALYEAARRRCG
jgi:hypothetical protein